MQLFQVTRYSIRSTSNTPALSTLQIANSLRTRDACINPHRRNILKTFMSKTDNCSVRLSLEGSWNLKWNLDLDSVLEAGAVDKKDSTLVGDRTDANYGVRSTDPQDWPESTTQERYPVSMPRSPDARNSLMKPTELFSKHGRYAQEHKSERSSRSYPSSASFLESGVVAVVSISDCLSPVCWPEAHSYN